LSLSRRRIGMAAMEDVLAVYPRRRATLIDRWFNGT
jgi:hypothetical protein